MADLEGLIAERSGVKGNPYSPERQRELARRLAKAQSMATTALRRLHRDDYHDLVQQARAKVAAESGPLPD